MTDRRDPHATPDDARWFREAVAPVVDAQPVLDGWREIAERVSSGDPTVVHLEPAGADRPGRATRSRRGRQLLAAAAVLAVIGLVAAFVLTRGSDDDAQTVVAVPGPDDDATGWYVPADLPEGWRLAEVQTDWRDGGGFVGSCPCTATAWRDAADPEAPGVVTITAVADEDDDPARHPRSADVPADLGDGVAGVLRGGTHVVWVDRGRSTTVASDRDDDELVDLATAVRADSRALATAGLTVIDTVAIPASARAFHVVTVVLEHPADGGRLRYDLTPHGFDEMWTYARVLGSRPVPDMPLPVEEVNPDPRFAAGGDQASRSVFVAWWPGADLITGTDVGYDADQVTRNETLALLRSLRPATAEEWSAFLDTATGPVEDDARADRLADLIVHEGDADGDGTTGTPDDTTGDPTDDPATATTASTEPATGTTTPGVGTTAAMARAQQLIDLAPQVAAGTATVPVDLFATSVDLGLDADVVRRMGAPNLASPDGWMIDEDDGVEDYQGWRPPFSAIELLRSTGDLEVATGGPVGCAGSRHTAPDLGDGQVLVTITPVMGDSCMNWFAVTLVVDQSAGIVGVHLYLTEP